MKGQIRDVAYYKKSQATKKQPGIMKHKEIQTADQKYLISKKPG
jgi:hypothetical protein